MSSICILQVEDDENDVLLLQHAFRQVGITNRVQAVADGQQAIDYLRGAPPFEDRDKYPLPGLLLLDLKMPRRSGLEVLQWVREQPQLKRMVVIVFSSASILPEIARAYELGANSFVIKPSTLDARRDFAQHLNGWWLRHNQFAQIIERGAGSAQTRIEGSLDAFYPEFPGEALDSA